MLHQGFSKKTNKKNKKNLSSETTNERMWRTIHFVRFTYGNQKHKKETLPVSNQPSKQSYFTERLRSLTGLVLFQPYYMISFESPAVACLPHIDVSKMRSQEKPNLYTLAITTER